MATRIAGKFDPSARLTPANLITIVRILATAPVVVLIVHLQISWVAAIAWVGVASTDFLDGWVARRQGATTSGAFLDPLADKVLVLGRPGCTRRRRFDVMGAGRGHRRPRGGRQRLPIQCGPPRRLRPGPAAWRS